MKVRIVLSPFSIISVTCILDLVRACSCTVREASEGLDLRGDEPGKARILSSMGAACVGSGREKRPIRIPWIMVIQSYGYVTNKGKVIIIYNSII